MNRETIKKYAGLYALNNLAFELITLSESVRDLCPDAEKVADFSGVIDPAAVSLLEKSRESLGQYFLKNEAVLPETVEALRTENKNCMKLLTDCVDVFTLTEYVLNRLEHRFIGASELPSGYTDSSYAEELIKKIAAKPQEGQNLLLVRIAEQLPARMTKNRFYDIVIERLSALKENDRSQIDSLIELVETTLCLTDSESDSPSYLSVSRVYRELSERKLNDLTKDEFDSAKTTLTAASMALNETMDFVLSLQTVLNNFEAVLLTEQSAEADESSALCRKIIRNMLLLLSCKDPDTEALFGEAYDACEELEGVIEQAEEDYRRTSEDNREDEELLKIDRLLSNSSFADLETDENTGAYTEAEFRKKTEDLLQKIAGRFKSLNKQFVRAMMSRFDSVLPPHFTSQEELEAYIYEAVSGCSDPAEKLGMMDVIKSILEE